jgi:hypothetical protein
MDLSYINISFDIVFSEGLLQDFVVLHIFIVILCLPLALMDRDCPRVYCVNYLAVYGSSCTLLHLVEV